MLRNIIGRIFNAKNVFFSFFFFYFFWKISFSLQKEEYFWKTKTEKNKKNGRIFNSKKGNFWTDFQLYSKYKNISNIYIYIYIFFFFYYFFIGVGVLTNLSFPKLLSFSLPVCLFSPPPDLWKTLVIRPLSPSTNLFYCCLCFAIWTLLAFYRSQNS